MYHISPQLSLDLHVEVQKDINGIEMGILDNGIPYLTQTGLANLVGVSRSIIYDISLDWESNFSNPILGQDRISWLKTNLMKHGYKEAKLYLEVSTNGQKHYAYPDIVCMTILEYYAFESKNKPDIALDSFRKLASYGLSKYIYDSLNYQPLDKWVYFNDRVSILNNAVPNGYFSIFHEITGMIADLINLDIVINHHTIPDISVGQTWAKYWKTEVLNRKYGEPCSFLHNYPKYYPQAQSNPQKVLAYPDSALPEFRKWFREIYLPTKFPNYILNKVKNKSLEQQTVEKISSLYQVKQINDSPK